MIPSPDMFDKYGNCKMFWLVKIFSACLPCSLALTCTECWLGMPRGLHHLLYCVHTDNPWSINKSHFTKKCLFYTLRGTLLFSRKQKYGKGEGRRVCTKKCGRKEGGKNLNSKWLQSWRPLKNLGWGRCVYSWLKDSKQIFLSESKITIVRNKYSSLVNE